MQVPSYDSAIGAREDILCRETAMSSAPERRLAQVALHFKGSRTYERGAIDVASCSGTQDRLLEGQVSLQSFKRSAQKPGVLEKAVACPSPIRHLRRSPSSLVRDRELAQRQRSSSPSTAQRLLSQIWTPEKGSRSAPF